MHVLGECRSMKGPDLSRSDKDARKMLNNATSAAVFYNNNAAQITQECRICEKAKETRAKVLFSKFRF